MNEEQPQVSNIYTWFAIIQILVLLTFLSKNISKGHHSYNQMINARDKELNHKTLKYRFLLNLGISCISRAVSLIFLMGRPTGLDLYFFYTFPVVFWMSTKFTFMGFLGFIYFQLFKGSVHTIRAAINWISFFLITVYVLFLLDAIIIGRHEILLMNVLMCDMVCYLGLLFGNCYFSYHIYNLLQEEPQIVSMLVEFKQLVVKVSGFYLLRILYFFLVSFNYVTFQNDIIMLLEIWFSEVMPYMYLITTKFQIQIDKANVEEANDTIVEMKEIKKGLHESLLDQNS